MNADESCCDAASLSEQHHRSPGGGGGGPAAAPQDRPVHHPEDQGRVGEVIQMMLGMKEDKKDKCAFAAAAAAILQPRSASQTAASFRGRGSIIQKDSLLRVEPSTGATENTESARTCS